VGVDYADSAPDVTCTLDGLGRRLGIVDGSGSRTLAYNATHGKLVSSTYGGANSTIVPTASVGYTFDADGRVSQVAASGRTTSATASTAWSAPTRSHPLVFGRFVAYFGRKWGKMARGRSSELRPPSKKLRPPSKKLRARSSELRNLSKKLRSRSLALRGRSKRL
jgi:hypothetical protein